MGRPANLQIRVTSDSQQAVNDLQQTETRVTGILGNLRTQGPALAAAAAAAIGTGLVAGIGKALEHSRIASRLAAQLGATGEDARRAGEAAGRLFSRGVTTDFQQAADAISATFRAGLAPPGTTEDQLDKIATKAADLASVFDQEMSQVTRAVSTMLRTGIAKNADQAFDVLTKGFQNGTNAADDLLDTFSEYSTQFRDLGISADQALGLMTQALKGGAFSADTVADALKELNIIIQAQDAPEALKTLGLNAKEMAEAFATGGPKAVEALDQITDRLRLVEDPAERSQLAVELLGTKAEDLSKALLAMDPSTAVEGLGQLEGSAAQLGNTLRDNAGAQVTAFKNTLEQNLVNFLGGTVIPAVQNLKKNIDEGIVPSFKAWAGEGDNLNPRLNELGSNVNRLSDSVDKNERSWRPLVNTIQNSVIPTLLDLSFDAINGVVSGVDRMVNALGAVASQMQLLIRWALRTIEVIEELSRKLHLGDIANFITLGRFSSFAAPAGDSSAAATFAAQNTGAATLRETFIAGIPAPGPRMASVAPNVFVTIDGEQLQGRITRTITSALQYEGARYQAGGWA